MNSITKQLEKQMGVDLNGDGVIGSGYGRGGSLIGKLEEITHIDLNNDKVIGRGPGRYPNYAPAHFPYGGLPPPPNYPTAYPPYGGPPPPPNMPQYGNPGLINELEKATNIDLNHDGRIGNGVPPFPNYPTPYAPYGGPPPPPNMPQYGNPGLINELEKATNIDLNHDGRIGNGVPPFPNYPTPYAPYGGPPPPPNMPQYGNPGLISELEKTTNIDLNGDGRIGNGVPPFPNYPTAAYPPYGGPPPPPNMPQYGNPGLISELEKTTNIDLNGDGRIGNGVPPFPNYPTAAYPPYGGPPPPPNMPQYGNPGLINELEKATNIDLNHDGRIGNGAPPFPNYPTPYPPYGGPPPPPNMPQYGNPGLINELEKATNIDLNHDGRIGNGAPPFPNYPTPYPAYGGPPPPPNMPQYGNPGLINELEKAINIDLNHDGRIGNGAPPFPNYPTAAYPPYGGPPPPPNMSQYGNPGLISELEKTTNIDLNGDGRIGGAFNPYPY